MYCTACGILIPPPGIELTLHAVEVWSPHHWTTKEVPHLNFNLSIPIFNFQELFLAFWFSISRSCFLDFPYIIYLFLFFFFFFYFFISLYHVFVLWEFFLFPFFFLCHFLLELNLSLNTRDPWLFTHIKSWLESLGYNWGTLPVGLHCRQAVNRWLFPWVSLGPLSGVVYFILESSYQYIS